MPGTRPAVLVIEDDAEISARIAANLRDGGFEVQQCPDGARGLLLAASGKFDAITMDRCLPDMDGLQVIRQLRDAGVQTPILMLSALGQLDDRLAGLRAGGDDYLIKPYEPSELVMRLQVLLRRSQRTVADELVLKVGDLELDRVARVARRNGQSIELLPMEYKLLEFMMRHPGQLLSRRMLFEQVWEYQFDPGTNLIDVHVGRLRKKLDAPGSRSFITTERGIGYVLNPV